VISVLFGVYRDEPRYIQGFWVLQVADAVQTVDPIYPLPPPRETINRLLPVQSDTAILTLAPKRLLGSGDMSQD
jgi:hypothetical protein